MLGLLLECHCILGVSPSLGRSFSYLHRGASGSFRCCRQLEGLVAFTPRGGQLGERCKLEGLPPLDCMGLG